MSPSSISALTGGTLAPPDLAPAPAPPRGVAGTPEFGGEGARVRFARVSGVTPNSVLSAPVWLPALLGSLSIDETANHSDYDTLSAGQFSQPAQGGMTARQLRTASLDTLTLDWDAAWLVASGQNPVEVRAAIYRILRSKKPVEMLITLQPGDAAPEARMNVTLRQVTRELRPAELDTRYLTVSIEEWRDPQTGRRSHDPQSRKAGVRLPTTHKLTATDTLDSLSKEYYGTYAHWRAIRDANGITTRFGQKSPLVQLPRLRVNSKLKIPKVS